MLVCPVIAHAATLTVDLDGSGGYTRIQDAVDAAHGGDTVLVGDGTFSGDGNRDIDFHGKSLTVKSVNGAAMTIIDCGGHPSTDGSGNHRGFYFHSGEKKAAISGLTVTNGYETIAKNDDNGCGGGIFNGLNDDGDLTLTNCIISGNTAKEEGGGVYNSNHYGTVTLINCIIAGNTAQEEGGGIFNDNHDGVLGKGVITLTNCTISGNSASRCPGSGSTGSEGGGVYNANRNGKLTLANCIISGNTATRGGGIRNRNNGGNISLMNCNVSGNGASVGGGIFNDNNDNNDYQTISSTITLMNCIVSRNTVQRGGGGIYNDNYSGVVTLTNCTILRNVVSSSTVSGNVAAVNVFAGSTALEGGGVCNGNGTLRLTNCTISGNTAPHGGGVCYNNSYYSTLGRGVVTLTNCILHKDIGDEIANDYSSSIAPNAIVSYSDIQGGYGGTGNINADPLFINAATGDLRLKPSSPCLGKGIQSAAPATDRDGKTRPNPPSMGAYELATGR